MNQAIIPEILAPAGNHETLKAALSGGAQAIYFGLDNYNARLRANNFTLTELPAIMRELHHYGRRGYLTLNTLLFDEEFNELYPLLPQIIESGIDALIVTDVGLIKFLHDNYPEIPLHASTQLTTCDENGCHFLETLGIKRVVLARELSVNEITALQKNTSLELEAFIHGAYCISYSGQCQASAALLKRSANRGLCAQLCRQKYYFVTPGIGNSKRSYLLSPHDLQGVEMLPALLEAGVTSFKIEGRLKSASYVYTVTNAYRKALDAVLNGASDSGEITAELNEVFNRSPGCGYLNGIAHHKLVPGDSSSYQGLALGPLLGLETHAIYLEPSVSRFAKQQNSLKPGDGIAIGQPNEAVTQDKFAQGGQLFSIERCRYRGSTALKLTIGPNELDPAKYQSGLMVFKNCNNSLEAAMNRALKREPEIIATHGLQIRLHFNSVENQATLYWELEHKGQLLTYSQDLCQFIGTGDHLITPEIAAKFFSRLGGTNFYLKAITLTMDNQDLPAESLPLTLAPSVLNQLRREACEWFNNLLNAPQTAATEAAAHPVIPFFTKATGPHISVVCRTLEQLEALLNAPLAKQLEQIFIDFQGNNLLEAHKLLRAANLNWGLALPYIMLPAERTLKELLALEPKALLIRTPGQLAALGGKFSGPLIGDSSLNIINLPSAALFLQRGLNRYTPGWEWQDAKNVRGNNSTACEQLIYTHRPYYVTRHCLLAAASGLDNCQKCPGGCQKSPLLKIASNDQQQKLTIRTTPNHYSVLFADKPTYPADLPEAAQGYYRMEFLEEKGQDCLKIVKNAIDYSLSC